MERARAVLLALGWVSGVWFSRTFGEDVEMRVRPGDNVTLYSDCVWKTGFKTVWFRNCSHHHQPPFIMTTESLLPRYSIKWNSSNLSLDLLVKNVSEADLGVYYCAWQERKTNDTQSRGVYYFGKQTTRLSLIDLPHPPVSDCSICWMLLVSVFSSLIFSICVYSICRTRTKDQRGNVKISNHDEVGEHDVCYATLDLPNSGQRCLKKKRRAESSDFSTYSEVKTERM